MEMENENMSLKEKLAESAKKVEEQKQERRKKTVKGSHLVEQFIALARETNLTIAEDTGFYTITGRSGKTHRIRVAKRGGTVDLMAFSVEGPAVRQVSREEAKEKHFGKVCTRFVLDNPDELVLADFRKALVVIDIEPPPAPIHTPRVPKVPKTLVAAQTEASVGEGAPAQV